VKGYWGACYRRFGSTWVLRQAGGACFYDSEVLNSSFVHLMKFSAENPRLRKAAFQDKKRVFYQLFLSSI